LERGFGCCFGFGFALGFGFGLGVEETTGFGDEGFLTLFFETLGVDSTFEEAFFTFEASLLSCFGGLGILTFLPFFFFLDPAKDAAI
jgi:hypothetical protein